MSRFEMTFEGVSGGPCPVCEESGLLLRHYGHSGEYRTIVHLDSQGHEHYCSLPESQGTMYTSGDRWWYVAGAKPVAPADGTIQFGLPQDQPLIRAGPQQARQFAAELYRAGKRYRIETDGCTISVFPDGTR